MSLVTQIGEGNLPVGRGLAVIVKSYNTLSDAFADRNPKHPKTESAIELGSFISVKDDIDPRINGVYNLVGLELDGEPILTYMGQFRDMGKYIYGIALNELAKSGGSSKSIKDIERIINSIEITGGVDFSAYTMSGGSTKTAAQLEEMINVIDRIVNPDAPIIPPTYIAPTLTLDVANVTADVGTSNARTIKATFAKNDAGEIISQRILRNGVEVSNTLTYIETGLVELGVTKYKAEVTYAQGAVKNSSANVPHPAGRIEAGTIASLEKTVTGVVPYLPHYWGEAGNIFAAQPSAITQPNWETIKVSANFDRINTQLPNSIEKNSTKGGSQWWLALAPKAQPTTNLTLYRWQTYDDFTSAYVDYAETVSVGEVTLDGILYNYSAIRPTVATKIKYTK